MSHLARMLEAVAFEVLEVSAWPHDVHEVNDVNEVNDVHAVNVVKAFLDNMGPTARLLQAPLLAQLAATAVMQPTTVATTTTSTITTAKMVSSILYHNFL